ncbi:MAG: alpha-glucan family phosphorylase, partial [Candidatus Brocadiia bacterium]
RLQQELVLGLGGVKALELLKIEPKIYHINEGHSVFLSIARLQKLMTENSLTFTEAKALVRASTVFTTHTPVIAGNENFKTEMVEKYLEPEIEKLGLTFKEFAKQGFIGSNKDTFWLPALAINFSKYINGVSKLHGEVSRKMWQSLFPERPVIEVPVDHVTNGVHNSWLSEPMITLLKRYIGPDYVHCNGSEQHWKKLEDMPDEDLWEAHHKNKHNLIAFIRRKLGDDLSARGYTQSKIVKLSRLFNPEYLTIVFARRFARYKRATLILEDKQRLKNILTDTRKPVQLIFAGKAHPADTLGKHMIKEVIDFIKYNHLEDRVIFLENYDINVARHLVWGADVWLNTPIREQEASGTSGMKAAINGVLNLSVLDGWWPEAYNGKNGWAITAGEFYKQSDIKEKAEADQIYDLIEQEISELFYDRNETGVPEKWVSMMKESVFSVCHNFNMNRVVTNYCEKFYLPAKNGYDDLCRNDFQQLKEASAKENDLLKYWDAIELIDLSTNVDDKDFLTEGDRLEVTCTVNLDKSPTDLVCAELFYMLPGDESFRIVPMQFQDRKGALAHYQCSFDIKQCGLQNINVRVKPADTILQDLHPEMIKWKK